MKEELIRLPIKEQIDIALWKVSSENVLSDKHILLTHGTFSNRKVLNSIAEYLVESGYICWIFEWRNHGSSTRTAEKFDFETVGQEDFRLVFNYLFEECKLKKIDCITHSGGGICLTIALINYPQYQCKINSISMFACQAFGAAHTKRNLAQIYLGKQLSKLVGKVPSKKIGGVEDESYHLMKQWFNWNLKKEFKGKSGIDYKAKMKEVKTPVLSIFGLGDTFIAPPIGCKKYLSSFKNPSNEALFCSIDNGFAENYNHSRILHSSNARKEIYPLVLDWITKNN